MTTDTRAWSRELDKIENGIQRATAGTLNRVSAKAHERQTVNVGKDMIVRTPYTIKSLKRYPASESKPIQRQNAIVGTVSPYLPIQDKGGTIKARRKAIAVPTNSVRGKDRRKRVAPRYRIDQMGDKAFILRPNTSGAQRMRKGRPVPYRLARPALFLRTSKHKLVKVRDLSQGAYRIKGRKWHSDAVKSVGTYAEFRKAYIEESRDLVRRYGRE